MKSLQKNNPTIGAQSYPLVDRVSDDELYVYDIKSLTIPASQSGPADYAFYDREQDKLVIIPNSTDLSLVSAERYVPIGVVVVPGTHDVYGDGSCGVMSLKDMSYSTPDIGNDPLNVIYPYISWGQNNTDTSLPNFTEYPNGNTEDGIPTGKNSYGYLPSDGLSGTQCAHDTDAYYSDSFNYYLIPSPYLTDGSRNPGYYQTTSPMSSGNALHDFNGKGNSEILWGLATTQNDWRTSPSINNLRFSGYSPAACCCWRYHTDGTQQGDWYLPAMGELGYIMPPLNKINEVISNLINALNISMDIASIKEENYLSSSEISGTATCGINTTGGVCGARAKTNNYRARAFLRINDQGIIRN